MLILAAVYQPLKAFKNNIENSILYLTIKL